MAKRIVWRGKNKGRYVSRQGGTTMHYHSGPIEMNLMPGRLVDRGASVTTVFEGYTARADAELLVDLREMGARRPGRDRELRLST